MAVLHADAGARTTLADTEPATRTALVGFAAARILHRREIQVAAHIRNHLVGVDVGPNDIGIAAADDRRRIARADVCIVLRRRIRIRIAVRTRHRRRDTESAGAIRHPHARALRFVRTPRAVGIRAVDQIDLVRRLQQHVLRVHVRSLDRHVSLARVLVARRDERRRAARLHAAAVA